MSVDTTDIKVVKEIYGHELDKYLKAGWVILCVAGGTNEEGTPTFRYSIGHIDSTTPLYIY